MFIALCIASTPLPYKTSQVCLDIFCSYIAFFVSTVVFFIFAGKKVPINKRVVVLLCVLLFSRVAFSAIPTFEKGTVKSRFLIWNVTLKMIKENPLMGIGPGIFFVMYPYYGIEKENVLRGTSLVVDKAHNDYLEVCAETGIVGLLLFPYLLFSVFKVSLVLYRGADRKDKLLIAGIVSSLVAICTNALASFPFKNPATLLIFWVDIAFIGALYRRKVGEKPVRVSYGLLKLYFLFFVLTGIVLSYMGIKADRYIFLAKNTKDRASLQYAEMATTYNPYSLNMPILQERLL